MNEENGQPQEQRPEEKRDNAHPPIPVIDTAESDEGRAKSAKQRKVAAPLHHMSRWTRFCRWFKKITVAEAGMLILTLAIAASSIVYTKYAKRQWRVMRDQLPELQTSAKAAKDAAETADKTLNEIRTENRPWVVITGADIMSVEPMEEAQVDAIFSNFGHTPALDTRFIAHLHVSSNPKSDLPEVGKVEDVTPAILAPTMVTRIRVHTIDKLSADQVKRVKQPDVLYYVYGRGTYQDTTTARAIHHVEFCVVARYATPGVTPCVGKRYQNTTD